MRKLPPLNDHADVTNGAICLKFSLSLYPHPYVLYVSTVGSGESAHLRLPGSSLLDYARSSNICYADSYFFKTRISGTLLHSINTLLSGYLLRLINKPTHREYHLNSVLNINF